MLIQGWLPRPTLPPAVLPLPLPQVMPRGSSIEMAREMVSEVDKKGEGRVDYADVSDGRGCVSTSCS